MTMIIDPTSFSVEKSKEDMEVYVAAKPDAAKWKGFYSSGAGNTFVELISGLSAVLSHRNVASRRETFLSYAKNRTSAIAIAEVLGYSVFRGSNAHLTLDVTPSSTQILSKYAICGSVIDTDIRVTEDVIITAGVPITINVVLGDLKSEIVTATTDKLDIFRFTSSSVSDDIRLLLNSVEVVVSEVVLDLVDDKFVALSNPFEAVDILSFNKGISTYTTGDDFQLDFIKLYNVVYTASDLTFLFGTLDSSTVVSNYKEPEDVGNIRVSAPAFHETQSVIKSRSDYKKKFIQLDTDLTSTNSRDVSPAVIELTYVKDDLSNYSAGEKATLLTQLDLFRPFGLEPPSSINDSSQVTITVEVTVTLSNNNTLLATVDSDVNTILTSYEKTLEAVINLDDIENSVEALSYVKIARVVVTYLDFPNWSAVKTVPRLININPTDVGITDRYFTVLIDGITGVTEPTWPAIGGTVVDGTVTWIGIDSSTNIHNLGWDEYATFTKTLTVQNG